MAKLTQQEIELVPGEGIIKVGAAGIEMLEVATVPGPAIAATQGRIWVKNDAPNTLWFTDDTGDDYQLGAGASALDSYSRVNGDNGAGSTNTNIFRWDTETASAGSDITYTDSATDGGYWAISTTGIYAVSFSGLSQGNYDNAINVASALSNTFDATHVRAAAMSPSGQVFSCSWCGKVSAGDEIWCSGEAALGTSTNFNTCTVTRVQ